MYFIKWYFMPSIEQNMFLGHFRANLKQKNTFREQAIGDIKWHFTKISIKDKLLFLAGSEGCVLYKLPISQKLCKLQPSEVIQHLTLNVVSIIQLKSNLLTLFRSNNWSYSKHLLLESPKPLEISDGFL